MSIINVESRRISSECSIHHWTTSHTSIEQKVVLHQYDTTTTSSSSVCQQHQQTKQTSLLTRWWVYTYILLMRRAWQWWWYDTRWSGLRTAVIVTSIHPSFMHSSSHSVHSIPSGIRSSLRCVSFYSASSTYRHDWNDQSCVASIQRWWVQGSPRTKSWWSVCSSGAIRWWLCREMIMYWLNQLMDG